jgi:3-hydroxyisobutyrate dehydrogenase-like beta-hydroxyacid dehydrogenase
MARHLRKAGFDVTAYDIDALACSEAQRSGIAITANPAASAPLAPD